MTDTAGTAPAHRNVLNIKPNPTTAAPNTPATPLRAIPSAFGSPSAIRIEDESVVLEIGARFMRVGIAGEAVPKAVIGFGPEEQRRAGDYRRWEVGYEQSRHSEPLGVAWGEQWELWRPDLRNLDLGLVGDKIDRALREAFTKYMLIDSRPRRMVLILPSGLPIPLLSTVLDTLFTNFQAPSISLMPAPILAGIAAGLRSSLVVDIGWAETVVTAVYEYREIRTWRSIRGTKMLGEVMLNVLAQAIGLEKPLKDVEGKTSGKNAKGLPSYEECEDILTRMAWCKPCVEQASEESSSGLAPVKEEDELRASTRSMALEPVDESNTMVSIPLSSTIPPKTLIIPFADLAEPCESALMAAGHDIWNLDDEELPLHLLVYRSLLQLPTDARSVCMSRILFVGGGSNLPGLKDRIMDEVRNFVNHRGWNPVRGQSSNDFRNTPAFQRARSRRPGPIEIEQNGNSAVSPAVAAAFAKQEPDPIEDHFRREAIKTTPSTETGTLRAVESLGAWAGGSLLSYLKIPAISIVDRDQWLQHGVGGASKTGEINVSQRQSMGPGVFKPTAGDRSSWTLGLFG